jgi:mannose-6-phosphate isomerase-like protein (cupin superfamily)
MEAKFAEIAQRIRVLRDITGFSAEEMAAATEVTPEEYRALESGSNDYSFTFLYRCAEKFGVDIIELLTGENPRLTSYTVVRKGQGLPIRRREQFAYYHRAAVFKDKLAEPFVVVAPYREEEQDRSIGCHSHEGQEFDYVLEGSLRFVIGDHVEELGEGDSVYYDSGRRHGIIALGGKPCKFLAIVMKGPDGGTHP